MRDPVDIATIEALTTENALLRHRLDILCGDDAEFHALRGHRLSPRAARMLVILAKQAPAVLSRQAIIAALKTDTSLKGIDLLVHKTRRVMVEQSIPGGIETIHGGGYRADRQLCAWVMGLIHPTDEMRQGELNFDTHA